MADNQQTTRKSIVIMPDGETLNLDYISQVMLGTNFPIPVANEVHILFGMGNGTSGSNALAIKSFGTQAEADAYYIFLQEKLKSIGVVEDRKTITPTLTSCTPNTGPAAGGTLVDVAGTFFETGGIITFDNIPAQFAWLMSPILMKVITPAHAAGAVTVRYLSPDPTVPVISLAAGFTYV